MNLTRKQCPGVRSWLRVHFSNRVRNGKRSCMSFLLGDKTERDHPWGYWDHEVPAQSFPPRTGSAGYPSIQVKLMILHCCLCSLQMRHKHRFLWVWHFVSKVPLEMRTCKRRKMVMQSNVWFLCRRANWQETIFATPRWVIPEQRQLPKRSFYTREFLLVTSTDQQGRNELSTQASSTVASHLQKQSYLSMENVTLITFEAGMVAQHFRGQVRGPLQVQD